MHFVWPTENEEPHRVKVRNEDQASERRGEAHYFKNGIDPLVHNLRDVRRGILSDVPTLYLTRNLKRFPGWQKGYCADTDIR